ncbi:TetR/AcrR family transcriptional regulator [Asticcacaulis sp. AND118]|uniref:TetR/AcrR family transcriptional regulator n=1 Tax=Asticcacaulis sp. AND118 TaxID=2840468 RepID=UPI001CFFC4EE|nr:TetR/AcrR family transcriptional regulator [Asticcacaulis sp. AND118]UDF02818.1 TetR/AcrR family transcriptional regulator [Asticcacaulis sp. AND118]
MTKPQKKQDIIDHAFELFYDHGFSLGVDAVMADTGISKRTLYKYFPSKEALIAELVDHYREQSLPQLRAAVEALSPDPKGRLMALFDVRQALFAQGCFRGCLAVSARLEYGGRQPEIEAAAVAMFADMRALVGDLSALTGHPHPDVLAEQAMVLFNGAVVAAQATRSAAPFDAAKSVLKVLLN